VVYADTVIARGNLIEDVTSTGYYLAGAQGIALYGDVGEDTLIANTIRRVHGRGFGLLAWGANVTMDSNAVSHADSAAVWVDQVGSLSMTGNNIRNNHQYGLNYPGASGATFAVQGNAFVNDSSYAIYSTEIQVVAQNNWWGLNTGSHSGAGSDSTFGNVDATAFMTTDPTPLLPALAPPIRVIAARPVAAAATLPVRHYVAPVRTAGPASTAATTSGRQATLADRMAAAAGDTSRVARAVVRRAAAARVRLQGDAARAQQRAQQAAAQATRAPSRPPQKGRAGQ